MPRFVEAAFVLPRFAAFPLRNALRSRRFMFRVYCAVPWGLASILNLNYRRLVESAQVYIYYLISINTRIYKLLQFRALETCGEC